MRGALRFTPGWTIAFVVAALLVGRSASALATARDEHARRTALLVLAAGKVDEIQRLRGKQQRVAASERPPQDIIASINRTLTDVGIRSDSLRGLEPISDAVIGSRSAGSQRHARQSVAATLENLTPADLGRFLARWEVDHPIWTPTRIELFHVRNQPRPARLYSARIELAAIYLSDDLEGANR